MTTSQTETTGTEEEDAAPPEAWDAIAEGYDRYVRAAAAAGAE